MTRNRQAGPDDAAAILAALIPRITYKHWTLTLTECDRGQGSQGLTLILQAEVPDSLHDGQTVTFAHLMPVPPAAYNEAAWRRWVLEQIILVEKHETLEHYKVDGDAPFFPCHGPGRDPYAILEVHDRQEAYAAATPWTGGPPTDPHFQ